MPPEILALIDKPVLLVGVLFVGALAGMAVEQIVSKQRRTDWRRRNAWRREMKRVRRGSASLRAIDGGKAADPIAVATDQLRTVLQAEFKPQPLLNRKEARLFSALNKMVDEVAPGWRVMAQVSLGEVLRSDDQDAYRCINSKRVDLLLIDEECRPLHAIEYQGGAHHQGSAAARDAVKKEALRRAGIGYVEVVAGDTPAELKRVLARLVGKASGEDVALGKNTAGGFRTY
ncbi:MAG: DUF2726 domain-containing protein [Sphingomicrobium sp.]